MAFATRAFARYSAALSLAPRLRITPNRRRLDKRFINLGFTIDTGGLPFFEVLLTIDRSLFDPSNAGRRSAMNFYASRQDSGLLPASANAEAIYLVPPAVLHSFIQAQPRPSEIFYTLVGYQSADGASPLFAIDPAQLADFAPSVAIASDITSQALGSVLGVAAMKLRRVGGQSLAFADLTVDPATDRAEGEDGYDLAPEEAQLSPALAVGVWPSNSAAGRQRASAYADETPPWEIGDVEDEADAGSLAAWAEDEPDYEELAYSDGFEHAGPIATPTPLPRPSVSRPQRQGRYATAQDSVFPQGMPEPEPLEDADDLGGDTDVGFAYSAAETRSFTPQAGHVAVAARASADDDPAESEERYPEDSERDDWFYQETDEGALASAYGDEAGDYDGPGYMALDDTAPPAAAVPSAQPLTIEDKRQIIEQIARSESGKARYGAINSDGEFKGRFGPGHPAYQRYHIGISYGIVQFTQDSGMLGRLLQLMFERDPETFRATFGPQAGELLRTTTTAGPSSREQPDGRSARVQPVGGADLWEEPWLTRFRQAAEHVSFQAAQNQLAASAFLDPILQFAAWLGLDTDRALTIVVDRAVQMGLDGARRWIIDAVGPIQTAALRQQALSALGKTDLRSFQAATLGLVADDQWGPLTHAAMVAALQQLGSGSPIPIPTRDQMLNAIVRRAADTPWAERAARLRSSPEFRDVVYQLP